MGVMQSQKESWQTLEGVLRSMLQAVGQVIKGYGMLVGVTLVALVLRLWDMDVPLNTDEAKWLSRGDEFFYSLLTGHWSETYTSPHPGVSTMWVAGLGMALNSFVSQVNAAWVGMDAPISVGEFVNTRDFPVEMYRLPRLLHALITAGCLGGMYELARRLFGWAIALLFAVLLLLEPFFLAYQRFLTTDALQANFLVLAALLFLLYLRQGSSPSPSQEPVPGSMRRSRWLLAGSGVCLGLAIGSKVIAIFMVPGLLLAALWSETRVGSPAFAALGYGARAKALVLWGATALVTLVVSWPALWLNLGFTLNRMAEGLLEEAQRGFFFFKGDLVHSPGSDFYLVSLAYRLSPAMLLGVLVGAIALMLPPWRRRSFYPHEQIALWLAILSYVGILSLATTKIDRYLSPVIPLLAVLAAAGWLLLLQSVYAAMKTWLLPPQAPLLKSGSILLLAAGLAIAQFAIFLPHVPYYITYYNPLVGGPRSAEDTMMIGQGEGLDQAAHWLADESQGMPRDAEVGISTVYPAVMAGFWDQSQPAQIQHLPMRSDDTSNPQFWRSTHRVVFYISQIQRQLPSASFIDYFTTQPYLFEVQQDGVNYAKIYPGPLLLPHELDTIPYPVEIDYGDRMQLLGYLLTTTTGRPDEKPLLTFYWNVRQRLPRQLRLVIELRDRQNQVVYRTRDRLWGGLFPSQKIRPQTLMRDAHVLDINNQLPTGSYKLYVGWRSRKGQGTFATSNSRDDSEGSRSTLAYVGVVAL